MLCTPSTYVLHTCWICTAHVLHMYACVPDVLRKYTTACQAASQPLGFTAAPSITSSVERSPNTAGLFCPTYDGPTITPTSSTVHKRPNSSPIFCPPSISWDIHTPTINAANLDHTLPSTTAPKHTSGDVAPPRHSCCVSL
jgi:hypothetical protein